jgi:hypothetical protein
MFNRSDDVKKLFFNRGALSPSDSKELTAVPELQLSKCGKFRFDGAHKIDVAIPIASKLECFAIEAKLGKYGLGKKTFEKNFLQPCGTSHQGTRITGKMISILEGKLPEECGKESVTIEYDGFPYQLNPRWILVARQRVINSWVNGKTPDLSRNCTVLSFESIAAAFGGREQFNGLVAEIIRFDYHQQWLE